MGVRGKHGRRRMTRRRRTLRRRKEGSEIVEKGKGDWSRRDNRGLERNTRRNMLVEGKVLPDRQNN